MLIHNDSQRAWWLRHAAAELLMTTAFPWTDVERAVVSAALIREAERAEQRYLAEQRTQAERLAWDQERRELAQFPIGG